MEVPRIRLTQAEHDLIVSNRNGNNIGIIGDTHEPFTHPQYRDFCYETFNKYGVSRIIHIGDEVDNHALSYHESDPDGMSAGKEAEEAQKNMDKWYQTFPDVTVMVGNHSALPYRQAMTSGIPKRFIKSYEEIWSAPPGWDWQLRIEIDGVLYTHIGKGGITGALKFAIENRQSSVTGHAHSYGGCQYSASHNDMIFGMNVGCGIEIRSYSFAYGKNFSVRPTLGCGVVTDNGHKGFFIPMNLGKKYQWIR